MKTADEILRMINEYLDNLPYERRPRGLYDPIKYVLSSVSCLRPLRWKPIITTRCSTMI